MVKKYEKISPRRLKGILRISNKTKEYLIALYPYSDRKYVVRIMVTNKKVNRDYHRYVVRPIPKTIRRWIDAKNTAQLKQWIHDKMMTAYRYAQRIKHFPLINY